MRFRPIAALAPALALVGSLATALPLHGQDAPSRTIAFATTEGTWVALDVAPDGQHLVFELLGDLYTLPVSGGVATPLLTGRAFQSQPRYSPDGTALAYVSDASGEDNVWIADADGSHPRQLTTRARAIMISPAWSPDGKSIFVTILADKVMRAAEVWRFDVASGQGVRVVENTNGAAAPLVSAPAPGAYSPTVSPDGAWLWFTSVTPRAYGSRNSGSALVAKRALSGGATIPVPLEGTFPMKPALSRDGRWLVYAAVREGVTGLRLRDLRSGEERWLRQGIDRNELESKASRDVVPNYAIAPDGSAVYVAFGGKIHRLALPDGKDTVIPFEARVSLEVTPTLDVPHRVATGPVEGRRLHGLALAHDGRIAVEGLARIWIARRDGTAPRRLTTTQRPREFMPAWSPDGKWIAYVTWDEGGGAVWKAPVDGRSAPVRLSRGDGWWIDPAWTPAGDSIVAITATLGATRIAPPTPLADARLNVPPDARVVVLPAAGGTGRTVTSADGMRMPHFANDPERVWLASPRGTLVSVTRAGTARRVEATLAPELGRGFLRVNADGTAIAAQVDGRALRFRAAPGDTAMRTLRATDAEVVSSAGVTSLAWRGEGAKLAMLSGRVVTYRAAMPDTTRRSVTLTVRAERPPLGASVVLRGATVVTMRGDEVVANADLVVQGERIVAVAPEGKVAIPVGAQVVDVRGKYIVPGFIDLHAHLGVSQELLQPEWTSGFANLAYGVTTVRDPQAPSDVFAVADIVEADGVPAPRIYSTGPAVGLEFGPGAAYLQHGLSSLDNVRRELRRYRDEYGTWFLKSYQFGPRREREWFVQASRELGMMPTTEGGADGKENLTHLVDGYSGREHAFPNAPIYDDVIQLFARSGVTYTPTLVVSFGGALPIYRLNANERPHADPRINRWFADGELYQRSQTRGLYFPPEDYNDADAARGATAVLRAGGHVALGGHGEQQGVSNHWEMRLLAAGGMTPREVLRVATVEGARGLGLSADLGSLEAGKLADLVVLDGDPLADIRNAATVRFVMKGGRLYKGETLDSVWPTAGGLRTPWSLAR